MSERVFERATSGPAILAVAGRSTCALGPEAEGV